MKQILPTKVSKPIVSFVSRVGHYRVLIFVIAVTAIYGYIVFTINSLSHAEPSSEQISSQTSPIKATKIDPTVIKQLQQLQDNSVSVKALFNETRNNPFQEN